MTSAELRTVQNARRVENIIFYLHMEFGIKAACGTALYIIEL